MKSFIYPQDITPINEKDQKFKLFENGRCFCKHKNLKHHYHLNEEKELVNFTSQVKEIEWISSYFMNN
jgi:hypothetical protein